MLSEKIGDGLVGSDEVTFLFDKLVPFFGGRRGHLGSFGGGV